MTYCLTIQNYHGDNFVIPLSTITHIEVTPRKKLLHINVSYTNASINSIRTFELVTKIDINLLP